MANGYTKLHHSIATSTIMGESPVVFKVFILLLALTDRDGLVDASVPGLARTANLTIEDVEGALAKLMSADPYSRTPDHDGRRIKAEEGGGWRLLNFEKYKYKLSEEDRKERDRIRQRNHRENLVRNGSSVTDRDESVTSVTECDSHVVSRKSRQEEEEEEEETKTKPLAHSENERVDGFSSPDGGNCQDQTENASNGGSPPKRMATARRSLLAANLYTLYPRKVAKTAAMRAIEKAIGVVSKRSTSGTAGDEEAAARWLADRVGLYSRSEQAQQPDQSKVPYPATWFNNGRYDDDETQWKYAGASGANLASRQTIGSCASARSAIDRHRESLALEGA